MLVVKEFDACDCHSRIFGALARAPLPQRRTLGSPIECLEKVWNSLGMKRAVLIQGSSNEEDYNALLSAISRAPGTRRGVVLLDQNVSEYRLSHLHESGIRGVRFNWTRHLPGRDSRNEADRLADAAHLLEKISSFGWHAEIQLDAADLETVTRLEAPPSMPIVIEHMARVDLSKPSASKALTRLVYLLKNERFWVKLSGADRLTANLNSLQCALPTMRLLLTTAPERCLWGLDWPHLALKKTRTDHELAGLLTCLTSDAAMLTQLLVHNPARLYGFAPSH